MTGFEKGDLMRTTGRFVLTVATLLISGIPLRAQAPSILEPKAERLQGPPLWISADAVADARKIVNLDLLDSPFLKQYIEQQRRELGDRIGAEKSRGVGKPAIATIPPSECQSELDVVDERGGTGSTATLSALAANSESILRGKIRTIDLGFDGGVPASLIGVEVSEAIKGSVPRSLYYVLYPVARFRIGPLYFCNANKGFEPRLGDEILLFDFTGPVDRDGVLLGPRLDQIVFESQNGALFLPSQLKHSSDLQTVRSLDEMVGQLRLKVEALLEHRGGTL